MSQVVIGTKTGLNQQVVQRLRESKLLASHHRNIIYKELRGIINKVSRGNAISAVKSVGKHGRNLSKNSQNFSSLRVGVPTTLSKHDRTHALHCQSRAAHVCKSNVFASKLH